MSKNHNTTTEINTEIWEYEFSIWLVKKSNAVQKPACKQTHWLVEICCCFSILSLGATSTSPPSCGYVSVCDLFKKPKIIFWCDFLHILKNSFAIWIVNFKLFTIGKIKSRGLFLLRSSQKYWRRIFFIKIINFGSR